METETRALINELRVDMAAGFAGVNARLATTDATLVSMNALLARHDHWFELLHIQHIEFRIEVQQELGALKTDVGELKTDVGALRTDVGALKTDVGALKSEMGSLKTEMGSLKSEMGSLKSEMSGTRSELHRFRDWSGGQFVEVKSSLNDLARRFEAAR